MEQWLMAALLFPMAAEDFLQKKVCFWWMTGAGLAGMICNIGMHGWTVGDVLAGAFVGGGLLLLSWKKGSVGVGDGVLFLAVGMIGGVWEACWMLERSLLLCLPVGLICRLFLHKEKDYRLPFAPFVLAAWILRVLC